MRQRPAPSQGVGGAVPTEFGLVGTMRSRPQSP
jgi:hypothetical protein